MTVLKTVLASVFVVATATSAFAMDTATPMTTETQTPAAAELTEPAKAQGVLTLAEALKETGGYANLIDATAERSSLLFEVKSYRQANLGS